MGSYIYDVHKKLPILWPPSPHLQKWTTDTLFGNIRISKHVANFKTPPNPLTCGYHKFVVRIINNEYKIFMHTHCAYSTNNSIYFRFSFQVPLKPGKVNPVININFFCWYYVFFLVFNGYFGFNFVSFGYLVLVLP